jgi:hypothetical protein
MMMRPAVLLCAMLIGACGGGGDDRAAPPPAGGGSPGNGNRPEAGQGNDDASDGGSDNAAGGAAPSEGGEGGHAANAAGAPAMVPQGVCEPGASFGSEQPQSISGMNEITLLSLTADELSIAFLEGSGSSAALYVGDRENESEAFSEIAVPLPDGYEATSGVALSSDGLSLVIVSTDHARYAELERSARGESFSSQADTSRFAKINLLKDMSGESVGWPVLSSDGSELYHVRHFGVSRVYLSKLVDGVFEFGSEIDPFTLGGDEPGAHKLITGLSNDSRAIFYYDEASGRSEALFRSRPGAPFYDPLDLGERRGVAPNDDCSVLYSSVDGALVRQRRD